MSISYDPDRRDFGACPVCGHLVTAVNERVESSLLCVPLTEGKQPGQRWRFVEPCGHEV